eukprot:2486466-Karenia_brevis.AAC.1
MRTQSFLTARSPCTCTRRPPSMPFRPWPPSRRVRPSCGRGARQRISSARTSRRRDSCSACCRLSGS